LVSWVDHKLVLQAAVAGPATLAAVRKRLAVKQLPPHVAVRLNVIVTMTVEYMVIVAQTSILFAL